MSDTKFHSIEGLIVPFGYNDERSVFVGPDPKPKYESGTAIIFRRPAEPDDVHNLKALQNATSRLSPEGTTFLSELSLSDEAIDALFVAITEYRARRTEP